MDTSSLQVGGKLPGKNSPKTPKQGGCLDEAQHDALQEREQLEQLEQLWLLPLWWLDGLLRDDVDETWELPMLALSRRTNRIFEVSPAYLDGLD